MKNELVQTLTRDDLRLSGLYVSGETSKTAVILIHGFLSDFYSHKFFHNIQENLNSQGIASVAVQTRGTGITTEIIKKDRNKSVWIGSLYEKLEDAHLDISAWIEFLRAKGYNKITLLGHSLGTIKSVRYLFEGEYKDIIEKIILLAPFDKNGYIERFSKGKWKEHFDAAVAKTKSGQGEEVIPDYYDDYTMSYNTYASWYSQTDLSCMWDFYRSGSYEFPTLKSIKIPTKIIVGDNDEFFYIPEFSTLESTKDTLKKNIENLDLNVIKGSGHTFVGFEDEVVNSVVDFLNN